jgi:hypothetical protein
MGGLLPIFVGVADFNRPKGRGIKPHGRIKKLAYTRVIAVTKNCFPLKIMLIILQFFIYVGKPGIKFVILLSFGIIQIFIRHTKAPALPYLKTGYSFPAK